VAHPCRSATGHTGVPRSHSNEPEIVPEHFLAVLYGVGALGLGAAVWSAMAVLFGLWSLLAAPGLGWMIGWASRYGGRSMDPHVRVTAWIAGLVGALSALFVSSAFSVTQTSPDAGLRLGAVGTEYLKLFTEPPWFGSSALLLTLVGVRRALRESSQRRVGAVASTESLAVARDPGAPGLGQAPSRTLADGPGSRAA
jgi:hypothetical protein